MPVPQILYLPREDVIRLPHLAHERAVVPDRGRQIRATVQKLPGRRDGEREQGDARPQDQQTDLRIGAHLSFPLLSDLIYPSRLRFHVDYSRTIAHFRDSVRSIPVKIPRTRSGSGRGKGEEK